MKYLPLLLLLGLGACTDPQGPLGIITDPLRPLGADFGNSVRTNIDVQVINPVPDESLADSNGQRIQNAIRRYETNTVYPPRPESGTALDTSTAQPGGGGGGAGAAAAPAR